MKLRKSGFVKRPLCLEHLERRAMLAGDVTAFRSGDTLIIRGDNQDNAIAIVETDNGGVAVVGLSSDGSPTEVNNDAFDVFFGIDRIEVDLRRGDDTVAVGNDVAELEIIAAADSENLDDPTELGDIATIDFGGGAAVDTDRMELENLFIQLGDGNDEAAIIVETEQRIHVELGKNNNELVILDSVVGDDIIVRGGKNIDEVNISDVDVAQVLDVNLGDGANGLLVTGEFGQSVIIHTGKHGDIIDVTIDTDDDLIIHSGSGSDTVAVTALVDGVAIINTGAGGDDVDVAAAVGENLEIITGAGNDDVEVVTTTVGHLMKVDTGANNDVVSIQAIAEILLVFLGSGNDQVGQISAQVDDFVLDAGSGNDRAGAGFAVEVEASGDVHVNMGSGNDSLGILIVGGFDHVHLHGGSGRDRLGTNVDENDDDVEITSFEDGLGG